jgi:4a-hydroxytetrahydrobiopterin dehydratase
MSEQGWRMFLAAALASSSAGDAEVDAATAGAGTAGAAATGVGDWVVLHGGATAVFRLPSLADAARLAEVVSRIPGSDGIVMTLTSDGLSVRLTRGVFRLEERHIDLARAISSAARDHGATADRGAAQEVQLAVAAKPEETDVVFWRAVLGYAELADDNAIDPLGHGSTVWMQNLDPAKQ